MLLYFSTENRMVGDPFRCSFSRRNAALKQTIPQVVAARALGTWLKWPFSRYVGYRVLSDAHSSDSTRSVRPFASVSPASMQQQAKQLASAQDETAHSHALRALGLAAWGADSESRHSLDITIPPLRSRSILGVAELLHHPDARHQLLLNPVPVLDLERHVARLRDELRLVVALAEEGLVVGLLLLH